MNEREQAVYDLLNIAQQGMFALHELCQDEEVRTSAAKLMRNPPVGVQAEAVADPHMSEIIRISAAFADILDGYTAPVEASDV